MSIDLDGKRFNADNYKWNTTEILQCARKYTQEQRDCVATLWLDNNCIKTFPEELCMLFPNVDMISMENNQICALPVCICSMTKLESLYFERNNLQLLPSNMTRLTMLDSFYLGGNTTLPIWIHDDDSYNKNGTQLLLQKISTHYGPIEAALRKSIVTLLGIRKFRTVPVFAFINRDAMAIIGQMLWHDYRNGYWERT